MMRFVIGLILAGLFWAQPVTAGQCGYDYCWGAVGFGPDGEIGWSYGQWSEESAYNVAQDGCGWGCTEVQTFYNACAAMARGNGGWGWAFESNRENAESSAVNYCMDHAYDCQVVVWACSR